MLKFDNKIGLQCSVLIKHSTLHKQCSWWSDIK